MICTSFLKKPSTCRTIHLSCMLLSRLDCIYRRIGSQGQWASGVAAKAVPSSASPAAAGAPATSAAVRSISIPSSLGMQPPQSNSAAGQLASPSAAIAAAPSLRDEVHKVSKAFKKNMRCATSPHPAQLAAYGSTEVIALCDEPASNLVL